MNVDYLKIRKLILKGDINGSDIKLIREMVGVDYVEKETDGILEYLDLTSSNIVEGGEIFVILNMIDMKWGLQKTMWLEIVCSVNVNLLKKFCYLILWLR